MMQKKRNQDTEKVVKTKQTSATGQVGPPLTCPLPDGAGYQVVLRNISHNHLTKGNPVLCSSKANNCKDGYECIQGLSFIGEPDGVCCPDQITTCAYSIFDHESGTLGRWGFDGTKCIEFKWDPEKPSSANNFKTKFQCENYCMNIVL
ncbi:Kunitz/Bovine pancreatic trypsin inhibitor domain protein [Dictyocaulus viviparus]|uniref:Kunitz/Bovine pancreatic trypsin inhibitor domain protein n=1 Tax=Dictyocaulus viviparus TaxID=29172 RepID=A0A0D8Y849_DICVI|nr:Kunitz/Bovine pancreatic trypsin inhibitor domain protein [Dictyocaulus viviparus]